MGIQEQPPTARLDAAIRELNGESASFQSTVEVDGRQIFFLSATPALAADRRCTVLLVHDQINDSFVWSEIKTIQVLAAHGYRCVALDLPSNGRSEGPSVGSPSERADFLRNFLESVQRSEEESFVLVGASMAGHENISRLIGVVGIALSDTQDLQPATQLPPTLAIRGELDTSIGLSASTAFKSFENVRQFVIPNGKHLCHLANSELFNRVLLDFLNDLPNNS
ncbi:AB hydrolase-1 domain-containing protein [Aphelenchoides fujianensis]|nr:AB hydrolase-1 domain-containing protein [Aphelenchoides fujianensis]